jgi:16S rRNA processing protein RimM
LTVEGAAGFLVAGRVGRAHGLDGSFYVTRPRPALLVLGSEVQVAGSVRTIERRSGTDEKPILRLSGVAGREGADGIRHSDLLVDRALAPPLQEGEYWAEDLEGCTVLTADGTPLGRVDALRALPSCEVLEVGELLIPLVADAVREVDLDARRIVVDAGFLGL